MESGRVREIWRYPVKSMLGERLERGYVGAGGLLGDRGWALRDEETGEIHNAKRHPILMQCTAAYREEPRADSVPHVGITLPDGSTISSDSPHVSQRNPRAIWDVRRFRPNVLVDTGSAAGAVENQWVNEAIRIGGFVVKGELLTVRCAMPMHAQADLPRDPTVLRTIVREANQCLGLYASVVAPGSVAAGDPVDRGPFAVLR